MQEILIHAPKIFSSVRTTPSDQTPKDTFLAQTVSTGV
jgi:hypothetical protein